MRRLALVLSLFSFCSLAGCLKYEIRVESVVAADGSIQRSLAIREVEEKKTWGRFQPPGPPYTLEGDEASGFRAAASLPPGRHGNGLRVLLDQPGKEYGGAEAATAVAADEGSVVVETSDLGIGTLYIYRETIAVGANPVRFRREAAGYADLGLRVILEACRTKWPDLDFGPVEDHARRDLLPRVVQAVLAIHQSLGDLAEQWRMQRYGDDPAAWLANRHVQVILAELAKVGVVRKPGAPVPKTVREYFNDADWDLGTGLLDDFLSPLPADRRAEVRAVLMDPDDSMKEVWPEVEKKLGLEQPAEELEAKVRRFVVDGLGAYFVHGIFDSFHLEFRVRLPGRVLATNGEIGALPEVRWDLGRDVPLALVSPELVACSFLPREGVADRPWSLATLVRVRNSLYDLTEEEHKALAAAVAKALEDGWKEGPLEGAPGDNVQNIYDQLRDLCAQK